MQVSLRVVGGKNEGRELKISVPEFIIGRGEGSHLRPQSDLISRQHCAIRVGDGKVVAVDLDSRNGTFINDERIVGESVLKLGDVLRIGRLQFEVLIDHSVAGTKKPPVEGVKQVAARVASSSAGDAVDEDSITDWLKDDSGIDQLTRRSGTETKQFMLDETERIMLEKISEEAAAQKEEHDKQKKADDAEKKKVPGKLPQRSEADTSNSRDAASQMLRKFFNRR